MTDSLRPYAVIYGNSPSVWRTSTYVDSVNPNSLPYFYYLNNQEKMTHNDLLTIIAELGIVGLIFLIFLIYKLYFELSQMLIYDRRNYYLSFSLITGSILFSLFHNNLTTYIFWFILFIPFIFNRNNTILIKQ